MRPRQGVDRPLKNGEFAIVLATTSAERGWRDLLATQRSALVDAWDRLTTDPIGDDEQCHALKGSLAHVTREGVTHERRQYELRSGARLWYFVEPGRVTIIEAHTRHPNETK